MPEHTQMVKLRKKTGGNTLHWEGQTYAWGEDGSITLVPHALAASLLAIENGGYTVEGDEVPVPGDEGLRGSVQSALSAGLKDSAEGKGSTKGAGKAPEDDDDGEVAEPAPKGEHEVTEPAPKKTSGSPITPRPRASTAKN